MRKMKDSGIAWIGEIPEAWEVCRLKDIAKLQTGSTPPKVDDNNFFSTDSGILWVKPDNLNAFNGICSTKEHITDCGAKYVHIVKPFCTLVCCIGTIGKIGFSESKATFNQQINAVIIKENYWTDKFCLYYIFSQEPQHWYFANGNVVKILNCENQGKITALLPPACEQQAIAEFLDTKCEAVDKLIALQNDMIQQLKAYKQSVITEAVTKGLDKSAPLKDSGIEWIGKIPQSWETKRLKFFATLSNEKASGDFPYIGLENIESFTSKFIFSENFYDKSQAVLCCSNSVLFGKLRPYLAKVYFVNETSCCSSELLPFSTKENSNFLKYQLLTHWFLNIVDSSTYGTKMPRANADFIKNMNIVVPPLTEQQQIADYLDKKCVSIDNLITIKQTKIEQLKEYKKSLIYEYVTGKKEVV